MVVLERTYNCLFGHFFCGFHHFVAVFIVVGSLFQTAFTADPCTDYATIDENWRDVVRSSIISSNGQNDHCDRGVFDPTGWYTFTIEGLPALVPTNCVQNEMCGSKIGMRVELDNQEMPAKVGQNITASLCGAFNVLDKYDCCVLRSPVVIARCQSDITVYQFTQPPDRCPVAVCVKKMNVPIPSSFLAKPGDDHPDASIATTTLLPVQDDAPEDVNRTEVTIKTDDGNSSSEFSNDTLSSTTFPEITNTSSRNVVSMTTSTVQSDTGVTTTVTHTTTNGNTTTTATTTSNEQTTSAEIQNHTANVNNATTPEASSSPPPPPSSSSSLLTTTTAIFTSSPNSLSPSSTTTLPSPSSPVSPNTDMSTPSQSGSTESQSVQTPGDTSPMPQSTDEGMSTKLVFYDNITRTSTPTLDKSTGRAGKTTTTTNSTTIPTSSLTSSTSSSLPSSPTAPSTSSSPSSPISPSSSVTPVLSASTTPQPPPPPIPSSSSSSSPQQSSSSSSSSPQQSSSSPISSTETLTSPSPYTTTPSPTHSSSPPSSTTIEQIMTTTTTSIILSTLTSSSSPTTTIPQETSTLISSRLPSFSSPSPPPSSSSSSLLSSTSLPTPPSLSSPSSSPLSTSSSLPLSTSDDDTHISKPTSVPEIVMTEKVRLVFKGRHLNDPDFVNEVASLVQRFLTDIGKDDVISKGGGIANVTSTDSVLARMNQSTAVDLVISHSMDKVSLNTFERWNLAGFLKLKANLTLIASCRPSRKCGEDEGTGNTKSAVNKSSMEKNLPVLVAVLSVCGVCLVVMVTGVICAKCRHRGSYKADSHQDVKNLQDSRTYFDGTPSPFTDVQIMKGEETCDGSLGGSAADGGADKENSWVVPLEEIDLDANDNENGNVATATEDTQL